MPTPEVVRSSCDRSPIVGATVRSASITYMKKRTGSLSLLSRESQAKERFAPSAENHVDSRLDLPQPAGARMRVNRRAEPPHR